MEYIIPLQIGKTNFDGRKQKSEIIFPINRFPVAFAKQ